MNHWREWWFMLTGPWTRRVPESVASPVLDRAALFATLNQVTNDHAAARAERQQEIDRLTEQVRAAESVLQATRQQLAALEAEALWANLRHGDEAERLRRQIADTAPNGISTFLARCDREAERLRRMTPEAWPLSATTGPNGHTRRVYQINGPSIRRRLQAVQASRAAAEAMRQAPMTEAEIHAHLSELEQRWPPIATETTHDPIAGVLLA